MIEKKQKVYELRRRPPPQHATGETALVYATSPISRLVCACRVDEVITMKGEALWNDIGELTGCTRTEYDTYFAGCSFASAIKLTLLEIDLRALTRAELKAEYGFVPPQSWRWAHGLSELVEKR